MVFVTHAVANSHAAEVSYLDLCNYPFCHHFPPLLRRPPDTCRVSIFASVIYHQLVTTEVMLEWQNSRQHLWPFSGEPMCSFCYGVSVLLQVEYPHKLLNSTVYIPQFLCRFESLSIILTHITNALPLVHEVWEIG